MQIDITCRNKYKISDVLRDYIDEKLPKLERFSLKIETAHVILKQEKMNSTCEIVLTGKDLRLTAIETTTAMQASFDAALGNVMQQLDRFHEKIKHHRHDKSKIKTQAAQDNEDEF